ncbi:MAG: hypothetical protein K2N56_06920 [Oscillospiraceae bacterium]|nr:hypothetical protein [Oscillospiraceae bacterium]
MDENKTVTPQNEKSATEKGKSQAKQAKSSKSAKSVKKQPVKAEPLARKAPQDDVIFALDIGTRTVVGVLAKKTPEGCKIIDMETVVHEKRSMSDGQIEDIPSVANDIKRVKRALENRHRIQLTRAYVAAAGRALKTLRASYEHKITAGSEPISHAEVKAAELEAVRRACADFSEKNDGVQYYCVGHGVISLTLDGFRVQKPEGHRGERLVTELICAFLPSFVVDSLYSALEPARLESAGLTLEPIAAMNAVVPQELRLINLALCDIGAGTSDVAISRDGSIIAYAMATTAGDEITETLMKELLVDFDTAERIKTSEEKTVSYKNILLAENTISREAIEKIIQPAAEDLAKIISEEIINANTTPPQAVFLVGGGCKLKGLAKLVADRLRIDPSKVITGSGGNLRGLILPEGMTLGAEHSTPMGIAISAGDGVPYDFTAITVNGKKLRSSENITRKISELMEFVKISPEDLTAGAGSDMSFTLSGEKITLKGAPATPSSVTLNGKAAELDAVAVKGDIVEIIPAVKGADGAAKLSDYFDMDTIRSFTVNLLGNKIRAGKYIVQNGREITVDRVIHDGDVISVVEIRTLGELLERNNITARVLINDSPAEMNMILRSGDIITEENAAEAKAPEKELVPEAAERAVQPEPVLETVPPAREEDVSPAAVSEVVESVPEEIPEPAPAAPAPVETVTSGGPVVVINGVEAEFPLRDDGSMPIFLDVARVFADDPTELLTHAAVVTINGKMARLDEVLHNGDVIVIE